MNALSLRSALAFPPPLLGLLRVLGAHAARALPQPRMELRIDVQQPLLDIDAEFEALHRRLHDPDDAIGRSAALPLTRPGLLFRHREADGEHYVYVVDSVHRCLAGYTVFNRLIEVDRRTDRHVRSPHSRYAPAYQGRGIATAVYEWGLGQGLCLVSGARQSVGAHALWRALGRRHPLGYVAIRHKRLHYLGAEVDAALGEALSTRLILLGRGWSVERAAAAGLMHGEAAANEVLQRRA